MTSVHEKSWCSSHIVLVMMHHGPWIDNTWLFFVAGDAERQWSPGVSPPPHLYSVGLSPVPLPRGVEQHHTKGDQMPTSVILREGEYVVF